MDLNLLHPAYSPEKNYKWKDRLNSLTGYVSCRFLDWSGWYNQDILQRLLGHYRLYQVFKQKPIINNHLPSSFNYIVNYKASHGLKYALCRITASLDYIFSLGERYPALQIEAINRILVNDKSIILHQFLEEAEEDFSSALRIAFKKIISTDFLNTGEAPDTTLFILNKNEHNQYQTITHYFNEYNQSISNGVKGKEKGVFSKKQLLILFDLLAENKVIDRIDYDKLNKFDAVASMFQDVSSKSKESLIMMKQMETAYITFLNNIRPYIMFTSEGSLVNS